ncbi:MAG: glycosyltransferase family 4 protein [Microthrixaceae bacterium]
MRILVVAELYPWPPVDGYRQRLSHMIAGLAQAGQVELIAVDRHAASGERIEPPSLLGLEQVTTLPAGPETPLRRWVPTWLRGGPPRRLLAMDTSELTATVLRRLDSEPSIDLVWYSHLDTWWPVHQALAATPRNQNSQSALRTEVVDFDNLENLSLKLRRGTPPRFEPGSSATARCRVLTRWAFSRSFDKIDERRWEDVQKECAKQVSAVVVCSALDVERSGCANAGVVGNGAVAPKRILSDRRALRSASPTLLFVGALDYEPNTDAVEWFTREVMPRILHEIPQARVRIVGRDSQRVSWVASQPGVVLLGLVDDLQPELDAADVSIVPIRVGAGTRLKVVESLANCIPMVTTSVGCEGINLRHQVDSLIAEDAQSFAEACIALLSDGDLRQRLSEAGHQLFSQHYEWSRIESELATKAVSWISQAQD